MIKLYSNGCPQCNTLKLKLDLSGVEFTVVSDMSSISEVATTHNLRSMPFLDTGEDVLTYSDALLWVRGE